MNWSNFLPLRFGGQAGGLKAWWRRLIARRSPAAPKRYLPLDASLGLDAARVEYSAQDSPKYSVSRESVAATAALSNWMATMVVIGI